MTDSKQAHEEEHLEAADQINSLHTYSLAAKDDSINTTEHITANTLAEPAKAANDAAENMVESKNQ
ncbi:hypothetical protein PH210_07360 [Paenibacillus sp. BSR1-1]|uniref:hypothetical protein n=1 Tax=Paenibacillus sp. BSR1-1 TaxID=3020845 RepID=UPI0025AFA3DA|nr:hypothetical protein [Paenibacillus sp. BSR1-1]MDN3016024.1 hypothetical protein [Paenibacillus sp. BSR1-1]